MNKIRVNKITVPDEIVFKMKCGRQIIRFDFDDPKYKELAEELQQFNYSMLLERSMPVQGKQWLEKKDHHIICYP